MNHHDIERILRLQNAAYETLLWINKRAEQEQELLSDANLEKWRYAESCEAWVRDIHGMIPLAIRPTEDDIPAFARLFSSFFQTSFHLVESVPKRVYDYYGHESGWVGSGRRKLMPGAPGGRKTPKGKAKVGESARELRLITLEELALENDLLPSRAQLETLLSYASLSDASLSDSLTLWTYFHELHRRSQFASQGAAVLVLWLAMDKKERENITAAKVVKAREVLVDALRKSDF